MKIFALRLLTVLQLMFVFVLNARAQTIQVNKAGSDINRFTTADFSYTGKYIAASYLSSNTISLFESSTGRETLRLAPPDQQFGPGRIFFNKDDSFMALLYGRIFQIYSIRSGRMVSAVQVSERPLRDASYSPKTGLITCILRDSIKVFAFADSTIRPVNSVGTRTEVFRGGTSSDGKHVLASDSMQVRIWNLESPAEPLVIKPGKKIMAFVNLDDRFAVVTKDQLSFQYYGYDGKALLPPTPYTKIVGTYSPVLIPTFNNFFATLSYNLLAVAGPAGSEYTLKLGERYSDFDADRNAYRFLLTSADKIRVTDYNNATLLEISPQAFWPLNTSYVEELEKGISSGNNVLAFIKGKDIVQKQLDGVYAGLPLITGNLYAFAMFDGSVEVWNVKEEKRVGKIKHSRLPIAIAVDEKSNTVFVSDAVENSIYRYDLLTGIGKLLVTEKNPVTALNILNGKLLYGTAAGAVKLAEPDGGILQQVSIFSNPVAAIAIVNNDRFIAGSYGRMVSLKANFSDTTTTKAMVGHNGLIKGLGVQPGGNFMASVAYDRTARIWDLTRNRLVKTYNLDSMNADRVTLYKDNLLLTAGPEGYVSIGDSLAIAQVTDPPLNLVVQSPNNNQSTRLVISNDGKFLAAIDNTAVKIRDLKTGFLIKEIKAKQNFVNDMVFTEDSKMLIIASGTAIECFDPYTGMQIRYMDVSAPNYSIHGVDVINNSIIAFNKHGWHNPIIFHKNSGLETGEINFNTSANKDRLLVDMLISPDKNRYATYGDKFIKLFEASTGKEIAAFPRRSDRKFTYGSDDLLDFSPDGKYMLYTEPTDTERLRIIETATGKIVKTGLANIARFGNNGKYLMATGKLISLGSINSEEETEVELSGFQNCIAVTYNSAENTFALGDEWGDIALLEGNYGKEIKQIRRWDLYTYDAYYSKDKRHVLFNNQWGLFNFDLKTLTRVKLAGMNYPMTGAFSPVKETLYYQRDEHFFEAKYNGEEERQLFKLPDTVKHMTQVQISEDGKIVQFGSSNNEMLYFYDIATGKQLWKADRKNTGGYFSISAAGPLQQVNGKYQLRVNGVRSVPDGSSLTTGILSFPELTVKPIVKEYRYSGKNWFYADIGKASAQYDLAFFEVSKSGKLLAKVDQSSYSCVVIDVQSGETVFTRDNPLLENVQAAHFDDNDKYMVLVFKTGMIEVYDLTNKETTPSKDQLSKGFKRMITFQGNENGINSVRIQNNLLLVVGTNAFLSIFDLDKQGEKVLSMVFIRDRDQLVIDKDGFYYATKNAAKYLAFKKGDDIYPFDSFDYTRNRPDKIMEVLHGLGIASEEILGAYKNAYNKRMGQLNKQHATVTALPVLSIDKDLLKNVVYSPMINIPVTAQGSANLTRLHVLVNGVPLYGSPGSALQGKTLKKAIPVSLSSGENVIRITVEDENNTQSYPVTQTINYAPAQVTKPNLYLITVSVSDYLGDTDLQYARKDGRDMIRQFSASGKFGKIFVDTLFDKMAVRENVLALKQKLMQANPDDQVILFLSGHGLLDKKYNFYYATYDCDFKDPAKRGIAYTEIENLLDGIPARRKLLLLDACHSGEIDKERKELDAPLASGVRATTDNRRGIVGIEAEAGLGLENSYLLMQDLFANLNRGSGAVVISAAGGDSYALESEKWKNGVFTYSILSGISDMSADLDKNKSITVSELREYVYKKVFKETGGQQKPTTRQENLEFDWVIWQQ